jgi:phosphate transport system protein
VAQVDRDTALRSRFHEALAVVDSTLSDLVHTVNDEVAGATEALLRDDRAAAGEIESQKHLSDPLYDQVGRQVEVLVARQAPVASDLRYLLAVLRAVPELEQSAALATEIAHRGGLGVATSLTPRGRALLTRCGDVVSAMWQELTRAWDERQAAGENLEAAGDELRDLHNSLTTEVASSDMPASIVMDMALIGRFYERLGDHAINIGERLDGLNCWPAPAAAGEGQPGTDRG